MALNQSGDSDGLTETCSSGATEDLHEVVTKGNRDGDDGLSKKGDDTKNSAITPDSISKTKSLADEALELMVNEPVPESYWKDLAEERRKALEDALRENEELHNKVRELNSEVQRLSELAKQAEYFASVIRELTNDKEDDEKTNEEPEEESRPSEDPTEKTSSESKSKSHPSPSKQTDREIKERK
ncbi:geminin-like [Ptychodera flava]|uniref:geminin-like n=1 Tax=Ptychodera flava TaxID=63121 RepID=UPI00396A7649